MAEADARKCRPDAAEKTEQSDLPPLECDLVMRGGVVNGLVYPGAVSEIARHYRLRSIGGTSAGALAAAAAAAMEFGRRSGRNPESARELGGIVETLAREQKGRTLLSRLIEPEDATRQLFDLVVAALKSKAGFWRSRAFLAFVLRELADPAGVALLVTVPALIIVQSALPAAGWEWLERGALWLMLFAAVLAAAAFRHFRTRLPALLEPVVGNGFGISTGWRKARADGEAPVSLTRWTHETIQKLAGLPEDQPLTFGDLWTARLRTRDRGRDEALRMARRADRGYKELASCPRDVDLTLITSDLNRRLLVQLPFVTDPLYARVTELEALFPEPVVRWLVARRQAEPGTRHDPLRKGLIRLPPPEDLPVLFAARLSLSFPLLISAVPLFIIREDNRGQRELVPVWLSDGGITSNFPIHLFDSPIPARPTLCLNLVYDDEELGTGEPGEQESGGQWLKTTPERAGKRRFLYMPNSKDGRISLLRRMSKQGPLSQIGEFLLFVFDAARFWNDNMAMDVPGYRERIIHIWMDQDDNAFDFAMPPHKLKRLDGKGRIAGEMIARRFLPDQKDDPLRPGQELLLTWNNHRFTRMRTFLAAMEILANRFSSVLKPKRRSDQLRPGYRTLLRKAGSKEIPRVDYQPKTPRQRRLLRRMTLSVYDLSKLSEANGVQADFIADEPTSPRPKAALSSRTPFDSDPLAATRRD